MNAHQQGSLSFSLGHFIQWATILSVALLSFQSCHSDEKINYNLQIKPIINAKCISCHGGVRQEGGFSLLFKEEATQKLRSGKYGIVPNHPGRSEMIRRLSLEDDELRMPYGKEKLSEAEIELLEKWINQGARFDTHWAYKPIVQYEINSDSTLEYSTAIDYFILEKLASLNLDLSDKADADILSRRTGLDLIGMAPSSREAEIFREYPTDANYEKMIDHLLASQHFGEKWASMWLDVARYADSKGYERDGPRSIWRFRDWVIKSFNQDMPYDQFVHDQIAGDLVNDPSDDQFIATAFHRNTMTNDEGGTQNEEYRTAAVIDRVNTTWEAFMGTSFACVQCHSHPYDPFKHEEYYEFSSFFNNTRDEDTYADYPLLRHYNSEQQKHVEDIYNWVNKYESKDAANEVKLFLKTLSPARNSLTMDKFVNSELSDTKWLGMRNNSSARLTQVSVKQNLIFRFNQYVIDGTCEIRIDSVEGKKIGTIVFGNENYKKGWVVSSIELDAAKDIHDVYFVYNNPGLRDNNKKAVMFDWLYFSDNLPDFENAQNKEKYWNLIKATVPTTPILVQNPDQLKRETHLLERGSWLSKGKKVEAGVPNILGHYSDEKIEDRRDLVEWMTSDRQPLVARTIVNRIWAQIFGRGLVETIEDMGSQGSYPSHLKLLDYLSWQLMHELDWSLKSLIKEILLSDTYQQSSKITDAHLEEDPLNIYLARMPRIRLSAEQLRDQGLLASGLLNEQLFGPPVMPYQPSGIWDAPYDGSQWIESKGSQRHRRAIYTYWKRTSPYPSAVTFDGVGREVCSSRRILTNTPLQALAILNDPVFIEISVGLTKSYWNENNKKMISDMYASLTKRKISTGKLEVLLDLYQSILGESDIEVYGSKGAHEEPAKFSAMTVVANSILNLDEVVNKI